MAMLNNQMVIRMSYVDVLCSYSTVYFEFPI
jgi:hypothetical protein